MKKLMFVVCLVLMVVFVSGCVSAKYETAKGDKVSYFRFGNQKMNGVNASKDNDGSVKLSVESSESTRDKELYTLMDRTLSIAESAAKLAK